MAYVQYGHQTDAERIAEQHKRRIELHLKELQEWQAVIGVALGVMIRSGANKASLKQVEDASKEYGIRFKEIMDYCSAVRLTGPNG